MIRTLPRQPIVIQSFAEFTDNSSPPSWPTVSEQMAKAYPRQERKRHSVTWRGLTDEVIPKRRALLLCSAVLLIPTHLPFPLGGFVGFFFFFQCWESNPGFCTTRQKSALLLSSRLSPPPTPTPQPSFGVASPSVVQAGIIGIHQCAVSFSLRSAFPRPIST